MPGQNTRSAFTANLFRALGGQAVLDDITLSRIYGISSTAYTCSEKRAFFVAGIPLYVGDLRENVVEQSPLDYFVSTQAPLVLYQSTISALLWGRVYLRKRYNREGWPTGLEWLNPACVREQINRATGFVEWYELRDPITFKVERVEVAEIIYIPTFDSRPGGAGLSKFEVAWRELNIQLGMGTFAATFFVNSANPDGMITFDDPEVVDEDYLNLVEQRWNESFKGAANAHRTAILPHGARWVPFQPSPKDLAMGELDERTSKRIHGIFDVDPALTAQESVSDPLSANSTYSAIEVGHIRNVALPFLKLFFLPALAEQWTHRDFGTNSFYTLYYDETRIPALAEANLVKMQGAVQGKNETLLDYDEARELVGYEKRDEGAYFIRSPKEAADVFQAGGITWNMLQKYTRGVDTDDPNGDVVLIAGQLLPRSRMGETAQSNADWIKLSQSVPQSPPIPPSPPSGGSEISISTPPAPTVPGLPAGNPPGTPALPAPAASAPDERTATGESLCIALGFANQPDLVGLQQRLRQNFADQAVEWRPADDFHITLLYAPTVTDAQAQQLVASVRTLTLPDGMALRVGSLNSFDQLGQHSLHFAIKKNADLLEFQEAIYDFALWAGIGISSYSVPAAYKPHITMGSLQTRPRPVTFDPKLALTPTAIWVYRGDNVIFERRLDTPVTSQPPLPPLPDVTAQRNLTSPNVGIPGATAILSLANNPALTGLIDILRTSVEAEGARWTEPQDLHVTFASTSLIDDVKLLQWIDAVKELSIFDWGSLVTEAVLDRFEQPDKDVLVLRVVKSSELAAAQQRVFDALIALGVVPGKFDPPADWQPHITLGYLPKGIPLPTMPGEAALAVAPSAVIVSRDAFVTMAAIPLSVKPDAPPLLMRSVGPIDPLAIVVGFEGAQAVRYATRDLDTFFRQNGYANPTWIPAGEWRLELAALEEWVPREIAAMIRQADFGDVRKIDLWASGYVADSSGTVYLRVEDADALEALRTSVSLELQAMGHTPRLPLIQGIPLCVVGADQSVDLTGAPVTRYPLVAANVSVLKGTSPQHQWTLRRSPRESRAELERWDKATRNKGTEYPFATIYLQGTDTERFVRSALAAEVERDEIFDLAYALLDGTWTLRSYADTRDGFVQALTDLFTEGQSSEISRRKFGAQLRMQLNDYGLVAFRDGMNSVGYDPESLSKDDVEVFREWQQRQSAYVTNLGAEIFGQGISEAEIALRVRMWADISLGEIRLRGIASGNSEKRYRWNYKPSAQHCEHCPMLNGQVHTMREWLDSGLWPGSGKTRCKQGCQCDFTETDDEPRGTFLRSLPAGDDPHDDHDHDHEQHHSHERSVLDDCVSEKIPRLLDEGKSQDEAAAIAYSLCEARANDRAYIWYNAETRSWYLADRDQSDYAVAATFDELAPLWRDMLSGTWHPNTGPQRSITGAKTTAADDEESSNEQP